MQVDRMLSAYRATTQPIKTRVTGAHPERKFAIGTGFHLLARRRLSARQARTTKKATTKGAPARAGETRSMSAQREIGFSEVAPAAHMAMLNANSAGALANFESQKTRLMPSF